MKASGAAVSTDAKWWLRVGGISGIVIGISYIIITGVYSLGGALPEGVEARLAFIAGHTWQWWLITGLSVLTDFLFIPLAVALYLALRSVNWNAMLVGSGLVALFVILDLAVTWPNYAALIALSREYAAAGSDIQRAALAAPASYAATVLDSIVFTVYAILVPSLGILVTGIVMLKGAFNKVTAYSGVGSGVLGVIAVVGPFFVSSLGIFAVFSSVLTTVWVLLAGMRLYRLGAA